MSYRYIFGYYTPEQKLENNDDLEIINNYFLFEYPPPPSVKECLKQKAQETWLSDEPMDWHPYNCFPLCTKEGVIIPDKFLPANILIAGKIEDTDFLGKKSIINAHGYIHFFQDFITRQLQVHLNDLMNTREEMARNRYLNKREFILQDTLYNRSQGDMDTPTQPYLHCIYKSKTVKPPSSDNFKIHLCPKPEYNFWTLFKMIQLSMTHPINDFRITNMKICIPGRLIDLRTDDKLLIDLNGGVSPGVIIYIMYPRVLSSNDPNAYNSACIKYLLQIAKYFNSVEDVIGNITEAIKLPFGNVRFNKLLCYASGTRANKLDILDGKVIDPAIIAKYNGSEWVQELCDAGDIATIERYFIKNICGTPGLNVIQLKDAPLPDPRLIESMVESPATGGAGGAAGGAGIPGRIGTSNTFGGYRKLKSRISKKTDRKKYKRRKTRK